MILQDLRDQYVETLPGIDRNKLYDNAPFTPLDCLTHKSILEVALILQTELGKELDIVEASRTASKQKYLVRRGERISFYSPHILRVALDIGVESDHERNTIVHICRLLREIENLPIRIGWKAYKDLGRPIVHIDTAPVIAPSAFNQNLIPRWIYKDWALPGTEW